MKKSFGAVCNGRSKVLILGSLPGAKSLEMCEYYAHPSNHFWPIMFWIFGREPVSDYGEKLKFLLSKRIALWDVVARAEREGSLDGNIRNYECNDIPGLLSERPNIGFIIFNGGFSERTFKRRFGPPPLPNVRVLSTSPACAGRYEEKKRTWKEAVMCGLQT